jgi:mitochondrial distribution and morphology protein 31
MMWLAKSNWKRNIHNGARRRTVRAKQNRNNHSSAKEDGKKAPITDKPKTEELSDSVKARIGATEASRQALYNRLQQLHRPSKEELLAAATGFWSRMKVRFKWFSIRSVRPFNMDDISAFFSWFLVGQLVWILVGTTTFFSLAILTVNTVFAQGKLQVPAVRSIC